MSGKGQRHDDYEIRLGENGGVEISTKGLSVVSDYLPDKSQTRETMTPVNLLWASIGL